MYLTHSLVVGDASAAWNIAGVLRLPAVVARRFVFA
jgi:hypothetical protein